MLKIGWQRKRNRKYGEKSPAYVFCIHFVNKKMTKELKEGQMVGVLDDEGVNVNVGKVIDFGKVKKWVKFNFEKGGLIVGLDKKRDGIQYLLPQFDQFFEKPKAEDGPAEQVGKIDSWRHQFMDYFHKVFLGK